MRWTAEDFAEMIGSFRRQLFGIVRRMSVKLTEGGVWQVAGHLLFDNQRETRNPENYPGIGLAARPPTSDAVEAIVVNVSGQNQPAIVGLRDEVTRAKVADLNADETALYNSLVRLQATLAGLIVLRAHANAVVEPTVKATTYRAAEDTMLTALSAAFTSMAGAWTTLGFPPQATACTAAATAVTTFQAAAATYLTTVVRVQ